MNEYLISPRKNLIEEVAGHLSGTGKDYSQSLVVFPGKRPSHFLRKFLSGKEGTSFIPPRIFSMDEFIDFLYESALNRRERKIETIDAVAILYAIHQDSPGLLGKKSFLSPDTFFPVGLKLYSDLEELHIEGILPARVKEIDAVAGEKIPAATAKKLQSLSYFYEAFYKRLEESGCSTRSSRYWDVSVHFEKIDLSSYRRIILAGFFALTRAEREIFKSLRQRENSVFLFQEGFGMDLSEAGIEPEKETGPAGKEEPEIHFYKSPDTHGQVFGTGNLLKEKIARKEVLDEKTVIVLPSAEALFPLLHHSLSLLRPDQYNISLGYPLQRTPLFGLFNNMMELVLSMDGDRVYIPYYLEFILHPYIKNIYMESRADITRVLFHTIEEALTKKKAGKFISLPEIEGDGTIQDLIREKVLPVEPDLTLSMMRDHLQSIHEHTIGRLLSFKNVGDFAGKMKEVIEYIYEKSTARLHPFFYPYSESFVTQLDLIARSMMKEIRFEEKASYFGLIKRVILHAYTPFMGTPLQGVQVLGFLETRNIKFERVFFLDVNEGILPDTVREDSLLPYKVRQFLGLPTYTDRERIMAYHFDVLVRGAREVHLFYVESNEKERSRFVERLLWDRQRKEKKSDDKSFVKTIQYAVTLQEQRPQPIFKTGEMIRWLKDFAFSASSLDTYLQCPLEFYYQYVLDLREREVVSEEHEREEIGLFVHDVLSVYFKDKTGRLLSEKDLSLKELEKITGLRFAERFGKDPAGETYLLKRQIETHLKDYIRNYEIPKIKKYPVEILGLEKKLEMVKENFRLTARLDRIERRGEKTVIVDYKTSANRKYLNIDFKKLDAANRENWSNVIGTLQLPFYLLLYSSASGEKPENIDGMFLLIGRTRIDESIELPLFEEGKGFNQKFGELENIIFYLLREVVDPEKPFMPTSDPKNRCDRCTYRNICTQ